MDSFYQYRRRGLVPLLALGILLYYFLVFLPLQRRAQSLDEPLRDNWEALCASLGRTNATALDFHFISNQLSATRADLHILQEAKKKAAAQLQLAPSLQARMDAPFQLVEYQNERDKELDEIASLASQQKVTIAPDVYAGFPEHTVDVKQPRLLWAALSMIDGLLKTALQCKLTAIQSLDAPLGLTNPPPANASGAVAELPLQLEFTGSAQNVARFLQALPLRAQEMSAAGLADAPPGKPPLFIERFVLRKQSPDKPDALQVFLRVAGFVLRK
jgi:hypothetical protein